MGYEIPGFKLGTLEAAADLNDRYRFVTANTSGGVVLVTTAGGKAVGVLQSPTPNTRAAEIMVDGVSKVEAGAAIVSIGPVTSDGEGRVIIAAAGNTINGIALETADAAGEIIAVLLSYGGTA